MGFVQKVTLKQENKKKKIKAPNIKRKTIKGKDTKEKVIKEKRVLKRATVSKEKGEKKSQTKRRYWEAVGRRKTSIARVRLFTVRPFEGEEAKMTINDKFYKDYLPILSLQKIVEASLRRMKSLNRFEISVKVKGGGIAAQAEAIRHGIARALVKFNPDFRKKLRRAGYLTRDPRMKERKKFGLKKARRAPQWSKR